MNPLARSLPDSRRRRADASEQCLLAMAPTTQTTYRTDGRAHRCIKQQTPASIISDALSRFSLFARSSLSALRCLVLCCIALLCFVHTVSQSVSQSKHEHEQDQDLSQSTHQGSKAQTTNQTNKHDRRKAINVLKTMIAAVVVTQHNTSTRERAKDSAELKMPELQAAGAVCCRESRRPRVETESRDRDQRAESPCRKARQQRASSSSSSHQTHSPSLLRLASAAADCPRARVWLVQVLLLRWWRRQQQINYTQSRSRSNGAQAARRSA